MSGDVEHAFSNALDKILVLSSSQTVFSSVRCVCGLVLLAVIISNESLSHYLDGLLIWKICQLKRPRNGASSRQHDKVL